MTQYTIHPIVMGTKVFDKSMMTYQHGVGTPYTIPIYCSPKSGNQPLAARSTPLNRALPAGG